MAWLLDITVWLTEQATTIVLFVIQRVELEWKWYDGWIGYFWDGKKGYLYICFPIPWLVWRFGRGKRSPDLG